MGFVIPTGQILRTRHMLYIAIGILGATVMPHNLYRIRPSCRLANTSETPREERGDQFATIDSTIALLWPCLLTRRS